MEFSRDRYFSLALALLLFAFALPAQAASPFSQNLQLWDTGSDVQSLQQFLNANGSIIAHTGAGSPEHETTTFGTHTYQALLNFQAAHDLPATGFFGPKTRATVNSLLSGGSASGTPSAASTAPATAPAATSAASAIVPKTGSTTAQNAPSTSTVAASTTPSCAAPAGLTCIPGTAIVQPAAPGNGWTPGFGQGGNPSPAPASASAPAPAPYVAQAVHIDNAVGAAALFRLYTGAAGPSGDPLLPNTYTGTCSFWFKTDSAGDVPEILTTWYIQQADNENVSFYNGDSANYFFPGQANLEMVPGQYFSKGSAGLTLSPNTWYNQVMSWNTDFPTNEKLVQIYLNAAPVDFTEEGYDSTPGPATVEWSGQGGDDDGGELAILPDLPNDTSGGWTHSLAICRCRGFSTLGRHLH